jgi:hypothetical protein
MAKKVTEKKEEATTVDYKKGLDESLEMSEALVREIDNIMSSNMPVQATGKVLGEVLSGFSNQVSTIKSTYSA